MADYSVVIGGYTLEVAPGFQARSEDRTRLNVSPPRRVATEWEWPLRVTIPKDTPPDVVDELAAFMAAAVSGDVTISAFQLLDSTGTPVPEIGDVRPAAMSGGYTEDWEDLRVTTFDLDDRDGQLVAGASFDIVVAARRVYPDANGVCELTQQRLVEPDEFGNERRYLRSEIRLAQSAVADGASIYDAAIAAQLREPAPTGFRRTKGTIAVGFTREFPLHPLEHYAICESEVTRVAGGADTPPPKDATEADRGTRRVEDPEKGVMRIFFDAEVVGAADGLTWVEDQAPTNATSEIEERPDKKTFRGKWQYLEPLTAPTRGKITREKREFVRAGGEREGGAILMSPPHLPFVSRGPRTPVRLVENVRVYALGATSDTDIPLPDPIGGAWILVEPVQYPEPIVDEDSRYSAQRLWRRDAIREYLWGGAGDDPALDSALVAAKFADASVTF